MLSHFAEAHELPLIPFQNRCHEEQQCQGIYLSMATSSSHPGCISLCGMVTSVLSKNMTFG